MKCPKCGYVSHDYLDACRKCSIDLVSFKHDISLAVLEPGLLNLSALVAANGVNSMSSANGNGEEYNKSDDFLGASMLVETEETESDEEEEVDIRLDDDIANVMPAANQAPTGSLTREFFVPDELLASDDQEVHVDDIDETMSVDASGAPDDISDIAQAPVTEEILNLDFDDETISSETFFAESMTGDSTDIIDMNALQELRDSYSEAEDVNVEAVDADIEADDLFSHDMDSASIDLDDTLLEEDAAITPSGQDDSQVDLTLDESAQLDISSLQDVDVAAEETVGDEVQPEDAPIEQPNATGSLELPDDFQLGDFQSDEVQPEDAPIEQPNASGSLELPNDFQLGDFQSDEVRPEDAPIEQPNASGSLGLPDDFQLGESTPEEPTAADQADVTSAAPAEAGQAQPAEPDQARPQHEQQLKSEKITLSFPIDPNTETLFFDQLSDTSELAPEPEQESSDTDVTEASPSKPLALDDLAAELPPIDLEESESTLELDLELELPVSEALEEEEVPETPIDTDVAKQDNSKAQS